MPETKGAVPVRTFERGTLTTHTAQLTPDDLFDKIINLRFFTREKSEPLLTIRSDYEVVYDRHPPYRAHYIPVKQKPHIKVSYHQVSTVTAIKMEVEVANLYFSDYNLHDGVMQQLDKEGGAVTEAASVKGNPIQWIEVQMGYRTQFPDWTKEPRASGEGYLARFFDLDNNAPSNSQAIFEGKSIMGAVLECHVTSYPPDQTCVFNCVVANLVGGLTWNHRESKLVTSFSKITAPPLPARNGAPARERTQIEKLLYHVITRRFTQTYIKTRSTPGTRDKPGTLDIFGYNDWVKLSKGGTVKELDTNWTRIALTEDNLLSFDDAEVFGVPCYVTRALSAVSMNTLASYALHRTGILKENEAAPPITLEETIQAQLLAIQKAYPGMRWYQFTNGGYFFYYAKESAAELYKDSEWRRPASRDVVSLPAIYDISLAGLRTIRCPFIGFINPTTILRWGSRYTLNTLVGYFYRPKEGANYYMALLINVVFDTDGDNNLMEIKCSDIPNAIAEARIADTEREKQKNDGGAGSGKNYVAVKRPVICHPKPAPTESCSVIIERYLRPSAQENLKAWGGVMPSVERMANDFKSWNPDYFTEATITKRKLGDETLTYFLRTHKTNFRCPWFFEGDKFWIYQPYLPSYDGVEVYTVEEPADK